MFTATFASMWITNVAAPVLCFSLLQPILRTVPAQGRPFSKALVMGALLCLFPAAFQINCFFIISIIISAIINY